MLQFFFESRDKPLGWVVFYCLLLGASFGFETSSWQAAVEHGQVLAGLVAYGPESVWSSWLLRLWSLINQFCALLLACGLDEAQTSMAVCTLLGAVSFLALGLVVMAVSGSPLFAVFGPAFIYVRELKGIGFSYPIDMMRTPQTFGIISFSCTLLVFGFLGNGMLGAALFLLGLLPAVHVSWAILCTSAFCLIAVLDKTFYAELKQAWKYYAYGLGLCAVSFFIQQWQSRGWLPFSEPLPSLADYKAFLGAHDVHRERFEPLPLDVVFFLYSLAVCVLAWKLRLFTAPARRLCTVLLAGMFLAMALLGLSRLLPDFQALQIIMPSRYMNVGIALASSLFFGCASGGRNWGILLCWVFILAITVCGGPDWNRLALVCAFFPASLGLLFFSGHRFAGILPGLAAPVGRLHRGLDRLVAMPLLACTVFGILSINAYYAAAGIAGRFRDSGNDPLFALVASGRGYVLPAAGFLFPQLSVRRPALFYPGCIDIASYFPEYLFRLNRMSQELYGLDLREPLPDGKRESCVSQNHRLVWEARTRQQWQELAEKYPVRDLLVPSDWVLDLPMKANNCSYAYYVIP
jgi:hypothetical protein